MAAPVIAMIAAKAVDRYTMVCAKRRALNRLPRQGLEEGRGRSQASQESASARSFF
jgi:hypothetical protein